MKTTPTYRIPYPEATDLVSQAPDQYKQIAETLETVLKTFNNNIAAISKTMFPVGSVFITTSNVNPSNTLGGTWVRYAKGRTLVGIDEGDPYFQPGQTGGEKAHTLTENEMPRHKHSADRTAIAKGYRLPGGDAGPGQVGIDNTGSTGLTGWGQAHNNMQPYIAVYMWTRTA